MDAGLPWNDFHFLNGAFRDSLAASACKWINPSLMRMSYQATGRDSIAQTVTALEGLTLDYQVPFPLNYMLGQTTIRSYCRVFVLLLQLRRCKAILQSMNFNHSENPSMNLTGAKLTTFYALRAKLIWFIRQGGLLTNRTDGFLIAFIPMNSTYYNHIVTYVGFLFVET